MTRSVVQSWPLADGTVTWLYLFKRCPIVCQDKCTRPWIVCWSRSRWARGALGNPVQHLNSLWDSWRFVSARSFITSWRLFRGRHSFPLSPWPPDILLEINLWNNFRQSENRPEVKSRSVLYKYLFKNSYIIHIFYVQNRNNRSSNRNSNS